MIMVWNLLQFDRSEQAELKALSTDGHWILANIVQ